MKWFNEMLDTLLAVEHIEFYSLLLLFLFTLWFIRNTLKFYKGEKRKIKNLHRFAREGESLSQYELAKRYAKGEMVKKSKHNAASFSQKAALSGDKEAKKFLDEILKNDTQA